MAAHARYGRGEVSGSHGARLLEFRKLFTIKVFALGCLAALIGGCSTVSRQAPLSAGPGGQHPGLAASLPALAESSQPPKYRLIIPDHPSIDSWTIAYSEKNPKSFQTLLDRAEAYVIPAQRIFAAQGLPEDLVYVALVESGFSPTAQSHANAVGMWQFIASTGKRFGLQQNEWVDERRHPFKAAQAAAEYLSHLYDLFGCWSLALAAYNCGENRVQATLDETGLKTFWELRDLGYLPAETRDYVPKVMAAIRISRNPIQYGFHYQPWHYTPRYETVEVPGGVKLCWLGERIGVDASTLKRQNPELCKTVTPPDAPAYELCVPLGTREAVMIALTEPIPPYQEFDLAPLRSAASRATRSSTASSKKTTVASARGQKQTQVKPAAKSAGNTGGKAVTPAAGVKNQASKTQVAKPSSAGTAKKSSGSSQTQSKTIRYSVQRGDTLYSIAERFRVSVDDLRRRNELNNKQKLMPGSMLIISTREQEPLRAQKKQTN